MPERHQREIEQLRNELQRRDRRDRERAAHAQCIVDQIRALRRMAIDAYDLAMRLALDLEP